MPADNAILPILPDVDFANWKCLNTFIAARPAGES
jgi:hypothetical protein